MSPDPKGTLHLLEELETVISFGKVNKIVGLIAEGSGIKAPVGSLCHILPDRMLTQNLASQSSALLNRDSEGIPVEVVGFREGSLLFMPYADLRGVQPGSLVRNSSLPRFFQLGRTCLVTLLMHSGRL